MQLQQNFLLQCMMLHWMFLLQITGDSIFIHITTLDITGRPIIIFSLSVQISIMKNGIHTITGITSIIHTSTTLDFIFMVTDMLMEDMIWLLKVLLVMSFLCNQEIW